MGERAIPVKYLDDKGKDEPRDMEYLYSPASHSEEGAKNKEQYPEKMDKDNCVCEDFVKHIILYSTAGMLFSERHSVFYFSFRPLYDRIVIN